jgi:hypothetical protein
MSELQARRHGGFWAAIPYFPERRFWPLEMSEYATQELALAVLSEIRVFHLVKYVRRWLAVFFLGLIDLDHLAFVTSSGFQVWS